MFTLIYLHEPLPTHCTRKTYGLILMGSSSVTQCPFMMQEVFEVSQLSVLTQPVLEFE